MELLPSRSAVLRVMLYLLKVRFICSCIRSQNANGSPFAKEYLTCCARCVEGTRWNKTFLKICRSFSQRSWCPEGNLHALCAWSAARAQRKTQFCFVDTPMSYSTVAFDNRPKGVFKLCHFVCGVLLYPFVKLSDTSYCTFVCPVCSTSEVFWYFLFMDPSNT